MKKEQALPTMVDAQNFSLPYPNPDPNPRIPHLFWLKASWTHSELKVGLEANWAPPLIANIKIFFEA